MFIIWVHNLFIICVHFGVAVYDFWLQLRKLIPNSSMQRHSNKNAKQMFPQKSIAWINSKQKTACETALNHEHWKFAQFITRLIQTKYNRPRLQWLCPSLPDHLYALTEVKFPVLYSKNFELQSNFKLPKCLHCKKQPQHTNSNDKYRTSSSHDIQRLKFWSKKRKKHHLLLW